MTYLDELIGRKIRDQENTVLGRVEDLLISAGDKSAHPRIVALAYTPDREPNLQLIRWTGTEDLSDSNVMIQQKIIKPYMLTGDEIYLARDLFNKQVIDTKSKQTVQVNNIELEKIEDIFCVTNVIVTGNVILQRIGVESIAERLIAFFHRPLPKRIVSWDDLNFLSRSGIPIEQPRETLDEMHPADIADIVENVGPNIGVQILKPMEDEKIADTLEELEPDLQSKVLNAFPEERAADIVEEMEPDEAADMLQEFDEKQRTRVINMMEPEERADVTELLEYHPDTAGGWMTTKYAWVHPVNTVGEALQELRQAEAKDEVEMKYYVYILDEDEHLLGVISLSDLVFTESNTALETIMHTNPVRVLVNAPVEDVLETFTHYSLLALPVVDDVNRLQGIITADHSHEMTEDENTEDILRMAGSDAEEMEQRSPSRTALLRLPWILATMFIELGAGLVIHLYDGTLTRVILLASFMPIISAISGNTGLQSATIIVRGMATNQVQLTKWRRALVRQLVMTLLLGSIAGIILGVIGAVWYGKWTFGLVVTVGMFAAVNIAGVVGTLVPLLSKRLGFDPAITSGPFETAFQDVVGISIYLTLATLMLHYL